MKLRTGLFLLVAGAVVPVLLLALVLGLLLIDHERETFRRGAIDRNRAFFSAVEAAVGGHVATLKSMSTSANLELDNVVAYERRLARTLESQPDWEDVMLAAPDGRRLLDVGHPDGVDAPSPDVESFERAVRTQLPAVGSVARRDGKYGIAIRYPVVRNRKVVYVISAILRPAYFQRLVEAQKLPEDWVSGLVDSNFHFIARVPPRAPGDMASPDFRTAVAQSTEGWYRGRTVEGNDSYTAFLKSPTTGWSIGLGIPASVVNASSHHAMWTLAIGTVIALILAVTFAFFAGGRIAEPMAVLAASARRLGRNEPGEPAPARAPFVELRDVGHALEESAAAIGERQALREREQAAMREADRAKDEFIAVLGHELRNPLSAIASSVHLQRVAPEGSAAAASAREIIERQTRQMTRLVEDLMDISRLAAGKLDLRLETFDLADLARGLVKTWERSKRLDPGRVRLSLASARIAGDRARMEQVLANLLDNANKFSPPELPIDLRVRVEGSDALLEIEDRGDGIEPGMIEQVFRPFVQGRQESHRPNGGLGLGLSVVQQLVALHGGEVSVASGGPGLGATFSVRLPLAAEAAGPAMMGR